MPDALDGILFTPAPMQTYALLDAARIPGLTEVLETSRLDHACLFRGDSFDQLKQVAPWLVRIEGSGKFTRNLFRASSRSWHLWDKGAGIFIRTTAPLDELAAHLRRFTKVSDKDGKWLFFRFWDPLVAQIYFDGMADHAERISQIFRMPSGKPIEMVVQSGPQEAVRMSLSDRLPAQPRRAITFEAPDLRLLDEVSYRALARQIAAWLVLEYPAQLGSMPAPRMQAIGAHVVATGRWLGLTMKQDFAFLAQMMMTSGGWFLQDGTLPAMRQLIADTPSPKAETLAAAYAGFQAQTPQAELLTQWDALRAALAGPALTPEAIDDLTHDLTPKTRGQIAAAAATTRARLTHLAPNDDALAARAQLLALLFGPRFFEDPFKPWADPDARAAIATAWRIVSE